MYFHHVSFSWLCFYTVLFGWSTTSGWSSEKTPFFRREKMGFFPVRQYVAFWLQHSHCGDGYHISLPTGLNLELAEISTSKLANSKQQMSKSILQFLKCTLISSPLVRWKWPTQVRTLGTLWWGWDLGMMQSTTPHKCPERFFGHLKKCCFFGPRLPDDGPKKSWFSGWLAIWLARYLAGWRAGGLAGQLAGWRAGWLTIWLAIWLAGWLSGSLSSYLACCGGLLAGWLIGWWLARWLADWVVACSLAACLRGWQTDWRGWQAGYLARYLSGWLRGWLAIWLFGWLSGWLAIWLAIWLVEGLCGFRWLSGYLVG